MIPFAALVLNPAVAVFGQPVSVTPAKSQPGAAAYVARGVYRLKPVEEQVDGTDLFHRTHQHELGIRLAGFPVVPVQGDTLTRPVGTPFVDGLLPDGTFTIFDVVLDGQGGADLALRKVG